MKFLSIWPSRFFLTLIVSLLIFFFNPQEALAQCGAGQICFPTVVVDRFDCVQSGSSCVLSFRDRIFNFPCDDQANCVSAPICSANDAALCQDLDPHPVTIACGWAGSGPEACSPTGCCGPGAGDTYTNTSTPTATNRYTHTHAH